MCVCERVRERERESIQLNSLHVYVYDISIYENPLHLMLVCVDNIFV